MHRRQLIRKIADVAFEAGQFVTYPDHPLLTRGPDVLGRLESRLVAWFVYTARSAGPGTRAESARILLSRLALPEGTTFVIVLVGRATPPAGVDLFDELQRRDVEGSIVERRELSGDAAAVAEQLRPYHFDRFAEAWANPPGTFESERDRSGPSTLDFRRSQLSRLPRWADIEGDHLVASLDSRNTRRTVLPMVQSLAVMAASIDFGLNNGLAGARETASMLETGDIHLSLHEMQLDPGNLMSSRTTDPYKAYRAAAFAGAEVNYPEEELDY